MIDGAGGRVIVSLESVRSLRNSSDEKDAKQSVELGPELVAMVTLAPGRKLSVSGFESEEDVMEWIRDSLT